MASPTPPQPITATVSPGRTLAVWVTAPMPVVTAQPIRAARSSGMSLRMAVQACSCTSMCSAKADRFRYWVMAAPSGSDSRGGSSLPRWVSGLGQSDMWPVRQYSQWPQKADRQVTTWSPTFTVRTSEPTFSTIPAASWPSTAGRGCL